MASSSGGRRASFDDETVGYRGVYIISVAARLLEMHPQTLRKYDRAGLVRPTRTGGMLRLYSNEDLERLRVIRRLVDDLGMNLAGVGFALEMVRRIRRVVDALEGDVGVAETRTVSGAVAELRRRKYWPTVGRVDNVHGDRNLFCSCVPVSAWTQSPSE